MKKVFIALALIGISFVAFTQVAQSADVPVSATLPQGAYGATITGVLYTGTGTDNWTTIGQVDTMTFGSLTEITDTSGKKLGVFAPSDKRYYAIDIGVKDGGAPTSFPGIDVAWSDTGTTTGLGERVGATYVLMTYKSATEAATEETIVRQCVNVIEPVQVNSQGSYVGGHWIRIYVGIITDPALFGFTDPATAAAHIFTYTTPAGAYSGTLAINIG